MLVVCEKNMERGIISTSRACSLERTVQAAIESL